jgi:hypothetical protein
MKIKRHAAISMFQTLGTMALGHLDEATLEATMDNFNAFRKAAEDFDKLKEELSKRLYANVDEKKKEDFFEIVGKYEQEKDAAKKAEYMKLMRDSYAELWPVYEKHIAVLTSLANKEIEVEITKVDKDAFILGILKGNKNNPSFLIEQMFGFMFKELEKEEDNFSELDELLK